MSAPTEILMVTIFEDTGLWLAGRTKGNVGTNITQASISSIALKVFDLEDSNTEVYSAALVVSSTVFDTLQTTALDPRWSKDSRGYNFATTIPASAFPLGRKYRVEIVFTPTSGEKFAAVAEVNVKELYSS